MPDIRDTDQISTFADPPENPLSEGGNWATVDTYTTLRKQAGVATYDGGDIAFAYWTPETFSEDKIEVWGIPTGGGLGAALEDWRLALWTNTASVVGYMGAYGGGLDKVYFLWRYNGGRPTFIAIGSGPGGPDYPSAMLLRIDGNQVELWASGDFGANWVLALSATDTTYRGDFYLSLGIEDPTAGGLGWAAFGGGIEDEIQQIYRRPNE
jgi:hypothetical protein